MIALSILFLLGIGNFALHKAVLESGHPLMQQLPWLFHSKGGGVSLLLEFFMLLGTMLMADSGAVSWAWGYGLYSAVNLASAWLILTRRV